jgi:carboxylesterase type B
MHLLLLSSFVSIVPSVLANPTANWIVGQEVPTTSGKVKGSPATRKGHQEVSQYVGIPFAESPVGPLRWAAPKPFKGTGSIDGTKWKDDCLQPMGAAAMMNRNKALEEYSQGMGGKNHTYSEDCLGLNIWTAPQKGEKSKAVLLWIHGGAFSSGNANADFMDGARYAKDEDVVLVSIHYRKLYLQLYIKKYLEKFHGTNSNIRPQYLRLP